MRQTRGKCRGLGVTAGEGGLVGAADVSGVNVVLLLRDVGVRGSPSLDAWQLRHLLRLCANAMLYDVKIFHSILDALFPAWRLTETVAWKQAHLMCASFTARVTNAPRILQFP